jgi:hypothetical protein
VIKLSVRMIMSDGTSGLPGEFPVIAGSLK